MKDISLFSYVKKHLEDDYAMNVLYYSAKKAFVERNYSLHGFSYFFIDGRFLGESLKISSKGNYRSTIHSLAFFLSLRLLMLNHKCLQFCDDDSLIFISKPRESFQWINYMTLILDNWKDDEIKMLFQMMENFYYDENLTEEEREEFKNSIDTPEYRNEREYYQYLAKKTKGVSDNIIGNNAFLEAKIERFTISKDIAYVGNTAFAYCNNLISLEFEAKPMFGTFPIIECANLKEIIVPNGLKDYFSANLPYYKDVITEKTISDTKKEEDVKNALSSSHLAESEIEHVYVDVPSADPYDEVEVSIQESSVIAQKEERKPIEVKILQTVFDKKATSYKYFWMLSIISLAKENHHLSISFNDITIRMAALAWPIVFEDDIDLGSNDMMKKYLEDVVKKTKLIKGATSNVVENYLKQYYSSQGVDKILAPLMKNVPYRFLSPWIKYTTDKEVVEKSCARQFNGLYALHDNFIALDEEWWEYIDSHYLEVCDFALRSFIDYAKKYNNDIKLVKLMTTGWQLIKKMQ